MAIPRMLREALVPLRAEAFAEAHALDEENEQHLGIRIERQKGDQWCWAAVATSVRAHLNSASPRIKQCVLAETVVPNVAGCCTADDKAPEHCDKPALLLDGLRAAGVQASRTGGTIGFSEVRDRIAAGRLVACRIDFPSPFLPHFVVMEGFIDEGGDGQYSVSDPKRGFLTMPVQKFRANYNGEGGRWVDTFFITGLT